MMGFAPLEPWYDRVMAIGHATNDTMTSRAAFEVAALATPSAPHHIERGCDPNGLALGQKVTITPDDNARVPVSGALVASDAQEIVIHRVVPNAGDVYVHFPRAGFDVVES
jgi:glutathione S-transferase